MQPHWLTDCLVSIISPFPPPIYVPFFLIFFINLECLKVRPNNQPLTFLSLYVCVCVPCTFKSVGIFEIQFQTRHLWFSTRSANLPILISFGFPPFFLFFFFFLFFLFCCCCCCCCVRLTTDHDQFWSLISLSEFRQIFGLLEVTFWRHFRWDVSVPSSWSGIAFSLPKLLSMIWFWVWTDKNEKGQVRSQSSTLSAVPVLCVRGCPYIKNIAS